MVDGPNGDERTWRVVVNVCSVGDECALIRHAVIRLDSRSAIILMPNTHVSQLLSSLLVRDD